MESYDMKKWHNDVDGLLKIAHFTLETMQFVSLLIRAKILKPFELLYALFCFGHDDNGVAIMVL